MSLPMSAWRQDRYRLSVTRALYILNLVGLLSVNGAVSKHLHLSSEIDSQSGRRWPSFSTRDPTSLLTVTRRKLGQNVADVETPTELLGALRDPKVTIIRMISASFSLNSSAWISLTQPVVLSRSVLLLGGGRYEYNGSTVKATPNGYYVILDCAGLVDRLQLAAPLDSSASSSPADSSSTAAEVRLSLQLQGLWLLNHLPPTGYNSPLILNSPSATSGASIGYIDCVLERYVGVDINTTAEEAALMPPAAGQPHQDVHLAASGWCPPPPAASASISPPLSPTSAPRCLQTALSYVQFSTMVWPRCLPRDSSGLGISNTTTTSSPCTSWLQLQNSSSSSNSTTPTIATPASNLLLVVLSNSTYGVQNTVQTACVRISGAEACIYQLQAQLMAPAADQPAGNGVSGPGVTGGLSPGASAGVAVVSTLCGCLALVLLVHFVRRIRDGHRTLTLAVRPPGATSSTTLLVTDIQNSTNLWEQLPTTVMNEALRLHHRCLRGLLLKCNGYESATEGDSFILAFHGPMDAARFAILAQAALLELCWPQELLEHEDGREVWAEPARPKMMDTRGHLGGSGGHGMHSRSLGFGSLMLAQASISGAQHGNVNGTSDDVSDDGDVNTLVAVPSVTATRLASEGPTGGFQSALLHSLLSVHGSGALSRPAPRRAAPPRALGPRWRPTGPLLAEDERPASSPIPVAPGGSETHPLCRHISRAEGPGIQEHPSLVTPDALCLSKPSTTMASGTAPYAANSGEVNGLHLSDMDPTPYTLIGGRTCAHKGSRAVSASNGHGSLLQPSGATSGTSQLFRGRSLGNVRQAETEGRLGGGERQGGFGLGLKLAPGVVRLSQGLVSPPEATITHVAAGGDTIYSSPRLTTSRTGLNRSRSATGGGSDGLVNSILESLTMRFVHRTHYARNTATVGIAAGAAAASAAASAAATSARTAEVILPGWDEGEGEGGSVDTGAFKGAAHSSTLPFSGSTRPGRSNPTWSNNSVAQFPISSRDPEAVPGELLQADGTDVTAEAVNASKPQSQVAELVALGVDAGSSRLHTGGHVSGGNGPSGAEAVIAHGPRSAVQQPVDPAHDQQQQHQPVQQVPARYDNADITIGFDLGPNLPNPGSLCPGPLGEGLEVHADVSPWPPSSQDEEDLPCSIILVSQEEAQMPLHSRATLAPISPHTMHRKTSFGFSTPQVPSRLGPRPSIPCSLMQPQLVDLLHPSIATIAAGAPTMATVAAAGRSTDAVHKMVVPEGLSKGGGSSGGSGGALPAGTSTELQLRHLMPTSTGLMNAAATAELLALLTAEGGGRAAGTDGDDDATTAAAATSAGRNTCIQNGTTGAPRRHCVSPGAAAIASGSGLHLLRRQGTQELMLPSSLLDVAGLIEAPVNSGGPMEGRPHPLSVRDPQVMDPGEELVPRPRSSDRRSRAHTFHGFQQHSPHLHNSLLGSAPLHENRALLGRPAVARSRTQALEMIPLPEKLPEVRQTWRQLCASNWPLVTAAQRLAAVAMGVPGTGPGAGARKRSSSLDIPNVLCNSVAPLRTYPETGGDEERDDAAHHHHHHHLLHHHNHNHHNRLVKTSKSAVLLFRGCRVRMGLHTGIPLTTDVTFNHTTGHMAYSGMPLKVAKAVGDSAAGGSVLLSNSTFNLLHPRLSELPNHPEVHFCGDAQIELVIRSLYMLVPKDQHPRLGYLAPLRNLRFLQTGNLDAPVGTVAICFMTVAGATKAVSELGQPAVSALKQFKSIVTRECCDCSGFVVEATDGLCLAAFMEPAAAAIWALRCREALDAHHWSQEVVASPHFREVREFQRIQRGRGMPARRVANVVCRGPRIRTGIDVGSVTAEVSSATARLSYRGKVMNRSARVAAQAADNQVLLSDAAWQRVVATAGICTLLADGGPTAPPGCTADWRQSTGIGSPASNPGPGQSLRATATDCGQEMSPRSGIAQNSPVPGSSFVSSGFPSPCHSPSLSGKPHLPNGPSTTSTTVGRSPVPTAGTGEGGNQLLVAASQLLSEAAADGDSDDVEQLLLKAAAVGKTLPSLPKGQVLSGRSAGRFTLKGVSEPQELFDVHMELLSKSANNATAATGAGDCEVVQRSGGQIALRTAATTTHVAYNRTQSFAPRSQPEFAAAAAQALHSRPSGDRPATVSGAWGPPSCSPASNSPRHPRAAGEGHPLPPLQSLDAPVLATQYNPLRPIGAAASHIAEWVPESPGSAALWRAVEGPAGAGAGAGASPAQASSHALAVDAVVDSPSLFGDRSGGTSPTTGTEGPPWSSGGGAAAAARVAPSTTPGYQEQQGYQEEEQCSRGIAPMNHTTMVFDAGGGRGVGVGVGTGAKESARKVLAGDALLEALASAVLLEDSLGDAGPSD